MTDQEVLQASIQKAIDGGYILILDNTRNDLKDPRAIVGWLIKENRTDLVLFDQCFCRALFGSDSVYDMTHVIQPDNTYRMHTVPAWQYHGTQMFLAEDRIEYLRKHLGDI